MKKNKQRLRTNHSRRYSAWQALYKALYSQSLYIDVAQRWRGIGLRYLFLVMMIATIPLSTNLMFKIYDYLDQSILYPISALPNLQIDNGMVLIDKPLPYFIKDHTGEVVGLITRFGDMDTQLMYYPKLSLLVTMNKIYFKPPDFQVVLGPVKKSKSKPAMYENSFENISHEIFSGYDWVHSSKVRSFVWVMVFSIYPITMLFFYGLISSVICVLSLFGQISAYIFLRMKLKYAQVCRLITVSATLPLYILFAIISLLNTKYTQISFFVLIILAIYFYAAVLALKIAKQKIARL